MDDAGDPADGDDGPPVDADAQAAASDADADVAPARRVAFLGASAVVLGALLPWFATADGAVRGVEGQGALALGAGVAAAAVALLRWSMAARLAVAGLGGVALAVAAFVYVDVASLMAAPVARMAGLRPGAGLYVTGLGGLVVALAGTAAYVLAPPTGRGTDGPEPAE